ncbi:phosphatidylserine decarboxylase 1, partial [Kickxella alabastrina]
FPVVNSIPYTLDSVISSTDTLAPASQLFGAALYDYKRLYFCVIYLAPSDFSQLSYKALNPRLNGVPLKKGQEVGGFKLGSTVVLVFSAPNTFKFNVSADQTVKMGEALGYVA